MINEKMNPILQNWDNQVELFASYFLVNARLPRTGKFTLLDVGCGTGTALRIIKSIYPDAQLSGCDLEPEQVQISKDINGRYGDFFISDIANLNAHWDFILLSNVLEHLYDWNIYLDHLLKCTNRLFIMVPYREKILSLPTDKNDHSFHVNSFQSNTFEYLIEKGFDVNYRIITTPYAWGPGPIQSFLNKYKLNRKKTPYQSEMLVAISRRDVSLPKPFLNYFHSFYLKKQLILGLYYKKYLGK